MVKRVRTILTIVLMFSSVYMLNAQISSRETGSMKGVITDMEGMPIPGVSVTLTSPALMGKSTNVTREDGAYRFVLLPPGVYTLLAELGGFQTVRQENIDIRLGLTVTLNIKMPQAALEEEVTVVGGSPVVDVKASTTEVLLKAEMLQTLPINRNLGTIITLTPGTVSYNNVKGGTAASNTYQIDGLNANDPCQQDMSMYVDFNLMEEVEVMTGGMPAEVGVTTGGFVNVITKSGGNKFSGIIQGFYTDKSFTKSVLPLDQLTALGIGKPGAAVYDWQGTVGVGGPIMKDKLWFYANGRYNRNKYGISFIPYTGPDDVFHDEYDQKNWGLAGFLKLTFQLSKSLQFSLMGNVQQAYNNIRYGTWWLAYEFGQKDDPWANYAYTGAMSWLIDQNTYLELRGGYTNVDANIPMTVPEVSDSIYNYDYATGYYFGRGYRGANEWTGRPSWQTSAHLTRFLDNVLGGDHELKAGVEVQTGADTWAIWANNPIEMYWWDGLPYWTGAYGDWIRPYYGDSYIGINLYTPDKEGYRAQGNFLRLGFYFQDSFTIKKRLTVNLGVRYDNVNGWIPDIHHDLTPGIAYEIGETYFLEEYGINPYDEFDMEGVKGIIKWGILTPRIGITYDLFGNGKTALKLHWGQYSDNIWVSIFERIHPLRWNTYYFNWWDENGNLIPDAPSEGDYYSFNNWYGAPSGMLRENWITGVDPDIKSPYDNQIVAGIDHELFKNFKVGLNYIYKHKKNIIDDAMYDLDTEEYWYNPETEPGNQYWVPFTTTVPAVGDNFPEKTVTLYYMSNDAPYNWILRVANVPEAFRKYSGFELTFEKRMSKGWQLGGSLSIAKTWGNIGGAYGDIHATTGIANDANWFVNWGGRTGEDRPWVGKLFGSFDIPFGILASFYYQFYSGTPWGRTVTVVAPVDWTDAANVVNEDWEIPLEISGTRRYYTRQNLDVRLEKTFDFKKAGTLGIYAEVFNLLGNHYYNLYQDPAGFWEPAEEGAGADGEYTIDPLYQMIYSISNLTRRIRFSIRFSF